MKTIRFIDLFAGLGGFRLACQNAASLYGLGTQCVFSSEIDKACQIAYKANFGETPTGDITKIHEATIPDHDLLLAGFPCQPFSIIGDKKGFEDARGTLFFDIARILDAKQPAAFVLENVKLLASHNKGKTLNTILSILRELGYHPEFRVLNALNFGLPQKRERTFIVGFLGDASIDWPQSKKPMKPLSEILEPDHDVPKQFWASDYIREKRQKAHTPKETPSIWHENKSGNISSHPFSCALRANASYNYLLVNGKRRFTPREMLRLQGFPESYKIVCTDSQTRTQAGNSLPIPAAEAVIQRVLPIILQLKNETRIPYPSSIAC